MDGLTAAALAEAAGVPDAFIDRLVDLKILSPEPPDGGFVLADAYRARFILACERSGLHLETIAAAIASGGVSLGFMDNSSYRWTRVLTITHQQLAQEAGLPVDLLLAVEGVMGSATPAPEDRVREDLVTALPLMRLISESGIGPEHMLRVLRVYVDSIRRIAEAEGYVWHTFIEAPLLGSGLSHPEMTRISNELGEATTPLQEELLLLIYRRQQERVWNQDALEHLEQALEGLGLYERAERSSTMAFLDLAGYTHLTEEVGDAAAAELAARVSELVGRRARERGGQAVKWLGDGVMVHFPDPGKAVEATLDIAREIPSAGLPPAHSGIACGPVVVQDGDYFGRTVNLASRVSARAAAGQTLVTDHVVESVKSDGVAFRELGLFELKGIDRPVRLHEAFRRG